MLNNVYLCVKNSKYGKYNCEKFDSFEKATDHFRQFYNKKDVYSSSMIPVCVFNPFQNYTLWYKLSKIFIKT